MATELEKNKKEMEGKLCKRPRNHKTERMQKEI